MTPPERRRQLARQSYRVAGRTLTLRRDSFLFQLGVTDLMAVKTLPTATPRFWQRMPLIIRVDATNRWARLRAIKGPALILCSLTKSMWSSARRRGHGWKLLHNPHLGKVANTIYHAAIRDITT